MFLLIQCFSSVFQVSSLDFSSCDGITFFLEHRADPSPAPCCGMAVLMSSLVVALVDLFLILQACLGFTC